MPRFKSRRTSTKCASSGGFTLIELLVSMTIFAVLLAIMMSVIVAMNTDFSKTQSVADGAAQGLRATQAIDKQLRYADWVNAPVAGATDYYISFETLTNSDSSQCYQWRLHTGGFLQERTWNTSMTPTSSVTATSPSWQTEAVRVVNPSTSRPFTILPTTALGDTQIAIDLILQGAGQGSGVGHAETKLVITARNTNVGPGSPQCNAVTP